MLHTNLKTRKCGTDVKLCTFDDGCAASLADISVDCEIIHTVVVGHCEDGPLYAESTACCDGTSRALKHSKTSCEVRLNTYETVA